MFTFNLKKSLNTLFSNKTNKQFSEEIIAKEATNSSLQKIFFNFGISNLPHLDKRKKGGEDAYMANDNLIAVADGVGGWNEVGVDPSLYSKDLCNNIKNEYLADQNKKTLDIFKNACKKIKNRGSSTCCICKIHSENQIEALNLGDSGYLLLRPVFNKENKNLDFNIVFKSEEQTHGFNFPYQVGEGGDNPASADVKYHEILPYDIVILATDGLWDNISNENLIKVIQKYMEINKTKAVEGSDKEAEIDVVKQQQLAIKSLEGLSDYITRTAEIVSLDRTYKSPFSIRSKGLYIGGKHDDITIIVAQILEKNSKF